jgi:predicted  nucleic acid-binding Zn-ribbon protein
MRALVLWTAVLLLSAACASRHHLPPQADLRAQIEAMREAVAEKVPDAQRAARLEKAIDGYEMQLLSFGTALDAFRAKVQMLNSRHDATRPEFDTLVNGFDRERIAVRTRLLELHQEMIAATTDAEWKELAKRERDVLSVPPGR